MVSQAELTARSHRLHRFDDFSDLRTELAAQVVFLRDEHGWSVEELARAAQLEPETVAHIEQGEPNSGLDDLLAIAHAFGYSGAELLLGVPQWMKEPAAST